MKTKKDIQALKIELIYKFGLIWLTVVMLVLGLLKNI